MNRKRVMSPNTFAKAWLPLVYNGETISISDGEIIRMAIRISPKILKKCLANDLRSFRFFARNGRTTDNMNIPATIFSSPDNEMKGMENKGMKIEK